MIVDDLMFLVEEEISKREAAASEAMREKCHQAIAKVGEYQLSEPDEVIIACLDAIISLSPVNHNALREELLKTHSFYKERITILEKALLPFAKKANTDTVLDAVKNNGVDDLLLTNGKKMCVLQASDFIEAKKVLNYD